MTLTDPSLQNIFEFIGHLRRVREPAAESVPREAKEGGSFMIPRPQAAVHDSGSEPQSPIFVLGGFIASESQWAGFSTDWQAALEDPPRLAYFKLTEAMSLSSKGQFSRKSGWNEQKRDNRLIELGRIIRKHAAIRVNVSISNEDFVKYVDSVPIRQRNVVADHPYLLLASQMLLVVALLGDQLGLTGPCQYFFDEQAGFSDDLSAWWPSFKTLLNRSRRPDLQKFIGSTSPTYRDERTFLPLQAADFYAGYLRRQAISDRRLVPTPAALQQVEGIPRVAYNVGAQLAEGVREALISSAEQFVATNPALPLAGTGNS